MYENRLMVVSFLRGGGNLIRTELQNEADDKEQERKSLLASLQIILLFSYQTNIKWNAVLTF